MRMIDYVQSVLASTPGQSDRHEQISDENWNQLKGLVQTLFDRLNLDFFMVNSARNRQDEKPIDDVLEEFSVMAQIHWANVRGERHQQHHLPALADLLVPQTDILREIFGLDTTEILVELGKVWNAQTFGLGDAIFEHRDLRRAVEALEAELGKEVSASGEDAEAALLAAMDRQGLSQPLSENAQRLFGMDLFDL